MKIPIEAVDALPSAWRKLVMEYGAPRTFAVMQSAASVAEAENVLEWDRAERERQRWAA